MVIGYDMGVGTGELQQLREGIVERFERPPTSMQEIDAAGMQIPSGGNAGQATDIMIVERHRPLGKPAEIRSMHAGLAIALHGVAIE